MNRENLPNHLANKARKIAYEKKVSTNSILKPMLIEHGFEDERGNGVETYSHLVGFDEDLDKTPSKETMEDLGLLG